ncbi:MAG: exodeoxyribonuclease V subunit alpha [Magnetococcales bacterium]|nr:exodeoxyribonuclease V subunit alpha [Magnetococcales bacterium]
MTPSDMLALLARWQDYSWLRPMDVAFAGFLQEMAPACDPWLLLAAALVSHQAGRGHVQLDLGAVLAHPELALALPPEGVRVPELRDLDRPDRVLAGLDLKRWQDALTHPVVVQWDSGGEEVSNTPLVFYRNCLYLRRHWQCEQEVRAGLAWRLATPVTPMPQARAIRRILDGLLPISTGLGNRADWQRMACALMARSRFGVITGGPGTGKTTTVVRLLALLQLLALGGQLEEEKESGGKPPRPLRIRLAAPTGKAAARLSDSITGEIDRLARTGQGWGKETDLAIPRQVTTLHRLLGAQPESRHFRHNATHPLWIDVLVIDEASMVGLELMADVLAALPASARLFLLGDRDQLASVEAGSLLGELCQRAVAGHYTPQTALWLQESTGHPLEDERIDPDGTPLDQAVVMLRRNFRFSESSGIGRLAQAVNTGDPDAVAAIWNQGYEDLAWFAMAEQEALFAALVVDGVEVVNSVVVASSRGGEYAARRGGYRGYLACVRERRPALEAGPEAFDRWATEVACVHGGFQVLCVLRQGPWGVEGLNGRIACHLREAGWIPGGREWYPGRPVMITRNNHELGLMNGDIGITLERPVEGQWALRVAFPGKSGTDETVRWFPPSRLSHVETVFALTVHKSQGSEFSRVALVLPDHPTPILTRELLYTGITRARDGFVLACAGDRSLLQQAVTRRVTRAGGVVAGEGGGLG